MSDNGLEMQRREQLSNLHELIQNRLKEGKPIFESVPNRPSIVRVKAPMVGILLNNLGIESEDKQALLEDMRQVITRQVSLVQELNGAKVAKLIDEMVQTLGLDRSVFAFEKLLTIGTVESLPVPHTEEEA